MSAHTIHEVEKNAIQRAIMDYYHEGHVLNDPALYRDILHPEWKFFLFDQNDQLRIVDRDEYMSWSDPTEVDRELEWETEFYNIDVLDNLAVVKLRLECQQVRFIDYFHMMKIEGKWWIVHKMSHATRKTA